MMDFNSESKILITGSTGYIGTHIVSHALSLGCHVRAVVRSELGKNKLLSVFSQVGGLLSFATIADLQSLDAYSQSLGDVTHIVHAASPFNLDPEDNIQDLLDPAINMSMTILEAAKRYGPLIERGINVSSFAAIVDPAKGLRPGHIYSEDDRNPTSYDEAAFYTSGPSAYCASKTLAERAMWNWMEQNQGFVSFDLSVINPAWVFGPYLDDPDLEHLSESVSKLWGLFDAQTVQDTDFAGFVDVKNVAAAAIVALGRPEAKSQRYLLGTHFDWQTAVDVIRGLFPEAKDRVPVGHPGSGASEQVYGLNSDRSRRVLGIEYTSLDITMRDTIAQLLKAETGA